MRLLLTVKPRFAGLAVLLAAWVASASGPFEPKPWLEDYQQLRAHVAVAYANLDDVVASGRVDLPRLDRETTAALRRSRSELEALRALMTFVGAFQDGHFRIVPGNHPLFSTGPRYDVRLAVDGERVVLVAPPPEPCALKPGDTVERINGRPVAAWLAELERLAGVRNPEQRRNVALFLLTRGPLAPSKELRLEGGKRVCRIAPAATPPSPPAAAPQPPVPSSPPVTFAMTGAAACEAMRFKARPVEAPYAGPEVPGFERLEDPANAFPAGLLTLAPGRTLGVVRIPLFSDEVYPSTCVAAWEAYRVGREGPCDERCQHAFRNQEVVTRLLADLAARVRRFQEAKVEGVVLDLTGNGGGTNWVDPAARIFGPKGMANLASGFIRHPHWVKNLEAMVADVDSDLARPELPEADRRIVSEARERLAKQAAEARATCPRDSLWTKAGATKTCPGVVRAEGAPYLPQDALPDVGSRRLLSPSLGYRFEEGLYTGPLVVLVDARTASAAEYAVSMLKDSAGARLVGTRTNGSGCGYTNGGVPVVLAHSGLRVVMPDCARYRKDGSNEVEGFLPDLPVPWSPTDSPEARARKWMDVLRAGLVHP